MVEGPPALASSVDNPPKSQGPQKCSTHSLDSWIHSDPPFTALRAPSPMLDQGQLARVEGFPRPLCSWVPSGGESSKRRLHSRKGWVLQLHLTSPPEPALQPCASASRFSFLDPPWYLLPWQSITPPHLVVSSALMCQSVLSVLSFWHSWDIRMGVFLRLACSPSNWSGGAGRWARWKGADGKAVSWSQGALPESQVPQACSGSAGPVSLGMEGKLCLPASHHHADAL